MYLLKLSKRATFALVLALIGCGMIGCAATSLVAVEPIEVPINGYTTVYLSSDSDVAEDISEELFSFDEIAAKKLNKSKLFKQVIIGTCDSSCERVLNIKMTVTHIKKVSGTARFFLGMFAGEASLEARTTITDAATKQVLGTYDLGGTSGKTGYSGDTKSALQHAANALVNLLKEKIKDQPAS
jgi:hypothetical protein